MKRLLAIILASLLILSSATAGASAYQAYKDDALTKYDFTDTAVLTTEQYASALLDYADKALAKANITKDLSILGKLDATSIDNALSSVYNLINDNSGILWMAGDLNKVEVGMLEKRRRSNSSDVEVIKSLLEFLGHDSNRKIVRKVVLGGIGKQRRDDGVSLGVANSFVKIDLNVEVMLRELIWGLAYPNTAYNSNTTVDTMVQTIIQNALAGVKEIPESVRNLVDLNSTKSTYDFIEDLLQTAYNDIAVPMLNDQTMKWLGQEIDKDTTGTLAGLFNRDFRVSAYTVPAGSTLVDHSLQYCQDCRCHTSCRNNQDYRKSQGSRNIISTCLIRIQTDPVIVPHHTFCHHKLRAFRVMHKPLFQALPVTKIQIQVLGINSQHLPVKHRINIIRSAFAGAYLLSGIFKCFHHCHCHRCLSTPTGRCRDYNSGNFHSVSPPSEII